MRRSPDSNLAAFARDGLYLGPDTVHVEVIHGPGRPLDWAAGSIEDLGYRVEWCPARAV